MKLKILPQGNVPPVERELFVGLKEFGAGKEIHVVLASSNSVPVPNGYLMRFKIIDGKVTFSRTFGANPDLVHVDSNTAIKELT